MDSSPRPCGANFGECSKASAGSGCSCTPPPPPPPPSPRLQDHTLLWLTAPSGVGAIANNGSADARQVRPDLMRPTSRSSCLWASFSVWLASISYL